MAEIIIIIILVIVFWPTSLYFVVGIPLALFVLLLIATGLNELGEWIWGEVKNIIWDAKYGPKKHTKAQIQRYEEQGYQEISRKAEDAKREMQDLADRKVDNVRRAVDNQRRASLGAEEEMIETLAETLSASLAASLAEALAGIADEEKDQRRQGR